MPLGFEEGPEESALLTPEMAERVVERFAARQAARQREEAAERERLASMAKVQELADLLGTTPEDVMDLAKEVHETPYSTRTKLPPAQVRIPEEAPRWPLHLVYLTLLAVCMAWGVVRGQRPYDVQAPPFAGFPNAVSGLHFDPYLNGTVRTPGVTMDWSRSRELLIDGRVLPPPTGVRLTLVTPVADKAVAGPPGEAQDSAAAAEALRKSVRSLIAFEESLSKVEGALPIVDYANAPWAESNGAFQGQPTIVGWHVVEVATNRGKYRALLPDRRYAKDLEAYEKALKMRLELLSDAKLFPSQPPANLRPHAHKITPHPGLPKGTTLMVWNGKQTAWTQGSATDADPVQTRRAVEDAIRQSEERLAPSMGSEDHLQVMLMYPVGEYTNSWPLAGATGYPKGDQAARQRDEIEEIARLAANPPKPPAPPPSVIRLGEG